MLKRFLIDKNTYYNRLNICVACDKFNSSLNKCTVNDVYIPDYIKYNIASCPIDKWQTVGVESSELNYPRIIN
jgi:hypothetical protein